MPRAVSETVLPLPWACMATNGLLLEFTVEGKKLRPVAPLRRPGPAIWLESDRPLPDRSPTMGILATSLPKAPAWPGVASASAPGVGVGVITGWSGGRCSDGRWSGGR